MAPVCVHGIDARFCAVCSKTKDTPETRRQAVQLRAAARGARTAVERESLEAVFAYEEACSHLKEKRFHASRTWQMIQRHGILEAVERIVRRKTETAGYRMLVEMGMEDMAFEAVVLRHPDSFNPEAVAASQARLDRLRQNPAEA